MSDIPVACTLGPADLQRRRTEMLDGLVQQAVQREAIAGGIRLRFPATSDILTAITRVVDAERQCCRFLRFQLTVDPDEGPVWLTLTGPAGTEALLSEILG